MDPIKVAISHLKMLLPSLPGHGLTWWTEGQRCGVLVNANELFYEARRTSLALSKEESFSWASLRMQKQFY